MTGPDINRPRAGSNAIGSFVIGVSPIGSINDFDVWQTILSQYANSPILTQLILNIDEYLDPSADLDSFFDLTWNVDTAQGWGLDVWGRIVGVSRTLSVPFGDEFLGFQEAGTVDLEPFNSAPFFSGQQLTNNFILTDSAYRTLIFAKALANICDGSIPAINQILLNLFPNRGNCYVIDNLDMSMTYRFDFPITSLELAIIEQSGALPKSTGVSASVSAIS